MTSVGAVWKQQYIVYRSQLGPQLCVYNRLRQQTWLQLLICGDERPDIGVVHHGSMRGRSFMMSPSTAQKRCQRPPAWPRRRKTSTDYLQTVVRLPDASAPWTYTFHHVTWIPAASGKRPQTRQVQRAVVASDVAPQLSRTCWQIGQQISERRVIGALQKCASPLSRLILLAAV